MEIKIPHSKDSENYIKRIFNDYEEIDSKLYSINKRTIVHMYPKEDTMIDGEDNLNGFIDAVLCDVHIYDTENMKFYKFRMSDEISVDLKCNVRVFKDLSTMIIIDEPIDIIYGKSIIISKK